MIQIRRVVEDDLKLVPSRLHDNEGNWKDRVLNHDLNFMWTLTLDGCPMLILGYGMIWEGVSSLWAIVGKDVENHGIPVTLAVRRFIDAQAKRLGVHRVEMAVRSEENSALVWAKVLGFQREATLHRYGADKSDYELMVRHY